MHNGRNFDLGDINNYGETTNITISQYMESSHATFFEPAGIKVTLDRFNAIDKDYDNFEIHYLSYDEIEYDGLENFTVDLTALGIHDKKDSDVQVHVEFFVNYLDKGFDYKFEGTFKDSNMAKINYLNDMGQELKYQDGGFWYPIDSIHPLNADLLTACTSVRIEKEWVMFGQEKQEQDIQFKLYTDGTEYSIDHDELSLKDEENVLLIESLPYYNQSVNPPKPVVQTVEEIEVDGFRSTLENININFNFTNTLYLGETFTAHKVWSGGPDKHPDIDIQLYQDGKAYLDPVTLTQSQLTYTWNDLPFGVSTGHAHVYSVEEISILDNYKKSISDYGTTIYNTFLETPIHGDKDEDLVPIIPPIIKPGDKDVDQTPTAPPVTKPDDNITPPVHTGD